MKQEPSLTKPTWWLLYAIGLLMLGLLALIAALVDEGTGRTILEVAVVVLVVPWMIVWVWRNRAAPVPLHARQTAPLGPTAIAIHDDGDVTRQLGRV